MLRVIVLGAAAGGGVPQWNCNCPVCRAARARPDLGASQASIAISCDDENWFLVNASPDIRQQINATRQLQPKGDRMRHSPIAGVILTNGEVDAIAGLLVLREGSPFSIYAHPKVLSVLADNSIFNVLNPAIVKRRPIEMDTTFEPVLSDGSASGLEVTAFATPGKIAWYLEDADEDADMANGANPDEGDTLGLHVRASDGSGELFFLAACARITPDLKRRIEGAPMVFFDGTVWRDDELAAGGLGHKTGQRMGHVAMSGEQGVIEMLADVDIGKKVFLHINNSNPAHLPDSAERRQLERAGWLVPHDGMEIWP
jgi:pyrroloquinoline quinone biosynthesis protein B